MPALEWQRNNEFIMLEIVAPPSSVGKAEPKGKPPKGITAPPALPTGREDAKNHELFSTENQLLAFQVRLALGGEALNPAKVDLPKITSPDELRQAHEKTKDQTIKRVSDVSTQERIDYWDENGTGNYDEDKIKWVKSTVKKISSAKAKAYVNKLKSFEAQSGIKLSEFTDTEAEKLYKKYFDSDTQEVIVMKDASGETRYVPSNVYQFVQDVIASYEAQGRYDYAGFCNDKKAIQWISKVFGNEYSGDIITELIDVRMKLSIKEQAEKLVNEANETKTRVVEDEPKQVMRQNYLNDREDELATIMYGATKFKREPATKPATTTPPVDPPADPTKIDPSNSPPTGEIPAQTIKSVVDFIGQVKDVVIPTQNPDYFISDPKDIQFTPEQLHQLRINEPFFIPWPNAFCAANPKIIPWDKFQNSPRFIKVEGLTDNDSGLLALTAVSAPDEQKQALLYLTLAKNILFMHKNDRIYLLKWLMNQKIPSIGEFAPYDFFRKNDHINNDFDNQLKPEQERLLLYETTDNTIEGERFINHWQDRIVQLEKAIKEGKIERHHYRWIEFLSHSVNVGEMVKMMKTTPTTKDDLPTTKINIPFAHLSQDELAQAKLPYPIGTEILWKSPLNMTGQPERVTIVGYSRNPIKGMENDLVPITLTSGGKIELADTADIVKKVDNNGTVIINYEQILEAARKLEPEKPISLLVDSKGLANLLPTLINPVEQLIQKELGILGTLAKVNIELVSPPNEIPIADKKANVTLQIKATLKGRIGPSTSRNFTITLGLKNTDTGTSDLIPQIKIDPPTVGKNNVQKKAEEYFATHTPSTAIKDELQMALGQDIELDKVELTFTPDNKLQITLNRVKKN